MGSGKSKTMPFNIQSLNRQGAIHFTGDPNFTPDELYSNTKQELGPGLYVTPQDNVDYWFRALQPQYAVPVDMKGLKVLDVADVPHGSTLSKAIISHYGSPSKALSIIEAEQSRITGDTFGAESFQIAQIRVYAKMKGYSALSKSDRIEGKQILIFDPSRVKLGKPEPVDNAFKR